MTSNQKWTCDGISKQPEYPSKPHSPFPNIGPICIECGLPREAVVDNTVSTTTTNTPGKTGLATGILIAGGLIAMTGLAGIGAFFVLRQPPKPPTPIPTPTVSISPNEQLEERFSSGERTLFPYKGNLDRDLGIEEFKQGKYQEAADFFDKASVAARNDPEPRIYYNNALARDKGSPITIATVVPVQNKATSAEEMLRGVADAQDQFNKAGGINDRLLEIIIVDDGNKPEIAKEVAQIIQNKSNILAVIGHNSSDASKAALTSYETAKLPMISPTSTSTSLQSPVFFRTVPSDIISAQALGKYVENQLNIKKLVIFYDSNSNYSQSLLEAFKKAISNVDILEEVDLAQGTIDINEVISSNIQKGALAAILLPSTKTTSVAIRVAKANHEQADKKMVLLGGDAFYNPDTLLQGSEAVEGMILAVPLCPSISRQNADKSTYAASAEKQWGGTIGWRTASSFDATQAIIQVLKTLKEPQALARETVLENLKNVSLSNEETSGEPLSFEQGERSGQAHLVKVVRRSQNPGVGGPQGSDFGFRCLN